MFSKKAKRPPVRKPNIPESQKQAPGKKELENWYKSELFRRDKIIDELKHKNELLVKTSMRRSDEIEELKQQVKRLQEKATSNRRDKRPAK